MVRFGPKADMRTSIYVLQVGPLENSGSGRAGRD